MVQGIHTTKEQFIERSNKIHNYKFDYSLVDYKNCYTKVKIICPICGIFEQRPKPHLEGFGCKNCYNNIIHSHNKYQPVINYTCKNITEQWIKRAQYIHGNIYDYSLSKYINNKTKLKIICSKHGIFEQTPDNHCRGKNGCPKCSHGYSKGEEKIEKWLIDHNIKYILQYKFDDCKNKKPLPFDFYLPDLNICIEFDGIHHYEPVRGIKIFEDVVRRDKIKNEYSIDNNIILIRIPYWESNNIDEILSIMIFHIVKNKIKHLTL